MKNFIGDLEYSSCSTGGIRCDRFNLVGHQNTIRKLMQITQDMNPTKQMKDKSNSLLCESGHHISNCIYVHLTGTCI